MNVLTEFRYIYHDRMCRPACRNREECSFRWLTGLSHKAFEAATTHLRQFPRDAAGARLILHDAACASRCEGPQRVEHARTQTNAVVALRKALARSVAA